MRKVVAYLAVGFGLYLFLCSALAAQYLRPSRKRSVTPEGLAEVSLGTTPAWVTSRWTADPDAHGKRKTSKIVFVLVHGYGGSRASWGALANDLYEKGYDCVVPSMPAHDNSPDPTSGFGLKEAHVVAAAASWVKRHSSSNPQVVALGVSMGGAACWLASQQTDQIDAIITEGAFARFDEATDQWFRSLLPGGSVLLRPVVWMASWSSGIDPAKINPVEAALHWRGKPAFVIQAAEDTLILRSHAERLAQASGAKEWIVEGAGHAGCYEQNPAEYVHQVLAFAKHFRSPIANR